MDPQEITLIEAARAGDVMAYREIVERYQQALYRFCYSILRNEAEAEDVVQETFIIAYRKFERYDPKYKFSTWLFTIARRRSLNVIRRAKRFVVMSTPMVVSDESSYVKRADEVLDIQRAVAGLPAKYREAIEMYYWQDVSQQEIADVLRINVGAVKARLMRAKELLRKELV